ncbi:MAG: hypothetical protein Kow0037_03650 [Calditrichia bacterium]
MNKPDKILIIEDDFDLLWLIKKLISMNGFEVLTAVTGQEAIETFSRNIFDIRLIILDLTLPDFHGKTLCEEIRKVSPDLPIIITSGSDDWEERNLLEKLGISHYLVKPFDLMKLMELISDELSAAQI